VRPLETRDCRHLLATTSIVALLTAAGSAYAQTCTVVGSTCTINSSSGNVVINPPPPTFTRVTVSSNTVTVTGSVINNGTVRSSRSVVAVNLN